MPICDSESPVFVPLGVMPLPKIHIQVALNVDELMDSSVLLLLKESSSCFLSG